MSKRYILTVIGVLVAGVVVWRGVYITPPATPEPTISDKEPPNIEPVIVKEEADELSGLSPRERQLMSAIVDSFKAGDSRKALELADAALRERTDFGAEFYAWLQQQMPPLLTTVGWTALHSNNCEEAVRYLKRAETLAPSKEITKGLAFCFYKLNYLVEASDYLAEFLTQHPDDLQMGLLFAEILESSADFANAIATLETVARHHPEHALLQERLARMRAKGSENRNQLTAHSQYFSLTYRAGEHEDLINYVLESLDQALDEFHSQYGFAVPRRRIEVLFYPQQSFSRLAGGPDWVQGLFDGRIRIPIRQGEYTDRDLGALKRTLRHELVHALLADMTTNASLPPWFNEGLAQRLECEDGCQPKFFTHNTGEFLSLETFHQPFTSFPGTLAEKSYRQSLYMIFALERDESIGASDVIYRSVRGLSNASGQVDSDRVLKPLRIDFKRLHARASELWQRHTSF